MLLTQERLQSEDEQHAPRTTPRLRDILITPIDYNLSTARSVSHKQEKNEGTKDSNCSIEQRADSLLATTKKRNGQNGEQRL
ncbi:hypothetical protein AVEN_163222-1 [Araneus ventricosus]|uniref:Uncharacterized protein n=1 Tax=Araneus ventricosus TaxID=182803 RepID=A0A4Y2Q9J6_ARAVE|nr:hypothetical protein AVEN_163222-1 [Araneus ventricosus]